MNNLGNFGALFTGKSLLSAQRLIAVNSEAESPCRSPGCPVRAHGGRINVNSSGKTA